MVLSVRALYRSRFTVSSELYFCYLLIMIKKLLGHCGISLSLFSSTETPDNVLMSNISGPLVQGQQFQMRCDVFNVAPVNKLSVHWYKGSKLVNSVTFPDTTVNPVNKSSVLNLSAHGDDHEQSIWCEAALIFGPGTDIPATRSQADKMEVLCRFLILPYLKNAVLFIGMCFTNSSPLLSSSSLLECHRCGARAPRWKPTTSKLHRFGKPCANVQLDLPRSDTTDGQESDHTSPCSDADFRASRRLYVHRREFSGHCNQIFYCHRT